MLLRLVVEDRLDQVVGDLALRSLEAVCDGVAGCVLAPLRVKASAIPAGQPSVRSRMIARDRSDETCADARG